jgi:hypothetical protein
MECTACTLKVRTHKAGSCGTQQQQLVSSLQGRAAQPETHHKYLQLASPRNCFAGTFLQAWSLQSYHWQQQQAC